MGIVIHIDSKSGIAEQLGSRVTLLGNTRTDPNLQVLNDFIDVINGAALNERVLDNFTTLFAKAVENIKHDVAVNIKIEACSKLSDDHKMLLHNFNISLERADEKARNKV